MVHKNSHSYHYSCSLPFHLADPAGIVFFGHVFSLAHQAFEQFILQQLECPWPVWFQNTEWIVPIKHTEADYVYPLHAGKDCQIELSLINLSLSSITLHYSFSQEKLCCSVKTIHVFCSKQTKQKMPIPPDILPRLQLFLRPST